MTEEKSTWNERPPYDGAELRPYEGRPDANQHMQYGSMVGGKWQPYKPPGLVCTGTNKEPTSRGKL